MIKRLLVAAALVCILHLTAVGATIICDSGAVGSNYCVFPYNPPHCYYCEINSCPSDAISHSMSVDSVVPNGANLVCCSDRLFYSGSTCPCRNSCACPSCSGEWRAEGTGTQRLYTRSVTGSCDSCAGTNSCGCSGYSASSSWQCQQGYSGTATGSGTGCTACGSADFYTEDTRTTYATGTTSGAGNGNTCYIGAGTYYDDKGVFTITGTDCSE
ncbi:MAG: hypothetical protein LBF28_02700 [Rickettsiales bacterium]|jgi:hypothetical protein|nr:hypothetical protein [Rickettsiales bacterium]